MAWLYQDHNLPQHIWCQTDLKSTCHSRVASTAPSIHHLWAMNHWIIHNLQTGGRGSSLKSHEYLSLLVHSDASKRGRGRKREKHTEKKKRKKKSTLSMRHTKVHPLQSKNLEVVGRVCRPVPDASISRFRS